jgi:hypothetical protein
MSESVTIELPDDLARQAREVAAQTHRRVEDILIEWLGHGASEAPVELLPDDQVLSFAGMQMSEEDQTELGTLLAAQREGTLDVAGHTRLDELMALYRRGMVRKAQALKVAVSRGLLPPVA